MTEQVFPTLIDRIIVALKNKDGQNQPILAFDRYRIVEKFGQGGQAVVFKILNKLEHPFALKVYHPSQDSSLDENNKSVRIEMHILEQLQHRNIPRMYAGGVATWDQNQQMWDVAELKPDELPDPPLADNVIYFYIMEFVSQEAKDFVVMGNEVIPGDDRNSDPVRNAELQSQQATRFEELCLQICDALDLVHSRHLLHGDIKEENIRYSEADSTFKLVDFGFAKSIEPCRGSRRSQSKSPSQQDPLVEDEYKTELGNLAEVLFPYFESVRDVYDGNRATGIERAFKKAKSFDLPANFADVGQFRCALQPYFMLTYQAGQRLILQIGSHLTPSLFGQFQTKLRIPIWGSILLPKEVLDLVDTPDFQRLRGVRQLGPTSLVFPGATHSRFEHSLGVYWLSLLFLERLTVIPQFREACISLDYTIKIVVLAALLHDIGHYPYSHWIEEIKDFPPEIEAEISNHEQRASKIINQNPIKDITIKVWKVDPDDVCNVIAGRNKDARTRIANSIIDGPIDADKLDYLIRDAIHCGVNYGEGIDPQRLFDSLFYNERNKTMSVNDKGRSVLMSVLTCRNIMYQEVYWHKTVRACDSMFKRFFYEYTHRRMGSEPLESLLKMPDDQFLLSLKKGLEDYENRLKITTGLSGLIEPLLLRERKIYKTAYIYSRNFSRQAEEQEADADYFSLVFSAKKQGDLVKLSDNLILSVSEVLGKLPLDDEERPLCSFDLIVDRAPVKVKSEEYKVEKQRIWNRRKRQYEIYPQEVIALDKYLSSTQQAYIFCSPKFEAIISKITRAQWEKIFYKAVERES